MYLGINTAVTSCVVHHEGSGSMFVSRLMQLPCLSQAQSHLLCHGWQSATTGVTVTKQHSGSPHQGEQTRPKIEEVSHKSRIEDSKIACES